MSDVGKILRLLIAGLILNSVSILCLAAAFIVAN